MGSTWVRQAETWSVGLRATLRIRCPLWHASLNFECLVARPSFFLCVHARSGDGADLQRCKRHLVSPTHWIDAWLPPMYRVKQVSARSCCFPLELRSADSGSTGPRRELDGEAVAVAR